MFPHEVVALLKSVQNCGSPAFGMKVRNLMTTAQKETCRGCGNWRRVDAPEHDFYSCDCDKRRDFE